ncbi:hypothetical protein [Mucilaginibacter corticis]|uniref:hypothetical protein n=1 Tax=Mucilaginibacter corticis TaxID=2597670 RepID=UPI0016424FE7|nr:hypothetical protein [Mucilaginibacter corticis]
MFEIFLALFLALSCPADKHTPANGGGTVTTQDTPTAPGGGGTGGDGGHIPPDGPPHH